MQSHSERFHREFLQEVHRAADADGKFVEEAFFDAYCAYVIDAGDLDEANRAYFNSGRGVRVDGYGGDPVAQAGVLTLITLDMNRGKDVETLTATDVDAIFKRTVTFAERALEGRFRNGLEESSPGFGLADLVAKSWQGTTKIRILLISNRVLSKRIDGKDEGRHDGRPVVYSVWDLTRLQQFVESGRAREDMVIELAQVGGHLPALPAHLKGTDYEAYLVVMPGRQLAAIYDKWGARLLEQNVRVFLQARGGVNKGIRATLENEPDMFFAYNNGVTATAEEVVTANGASGLTITKLKNFQIVNGGQTTASIYAGSTNPAVDLAAVSVQIKLSVIPPERAEEVVPKISQYANSQNRVSAADFFSNHPFHLRMKSFSEVTFAPATDGAFRQSKWFYERARGQYHDARGRLTPAEQKRFDLEYPQAQLFSKTDLAKFVNVWDCKPDLVSRGAQKNFAAFAEVIGRKWENGSDGFNERYFTTVVAKALAFRATERIVTAKPWYEGGYRANIVAYAIAKLAHDIAGQKGAVDFDRIWDRQAITPAMEQALGAAADAVREVIQNPPDGSVRNITEWAKQQRCWELVAALNVRWPASWLDELVTEDDHASLARAAKRQQRVLNGIEAQKAVVGGGAGFWREVKAWAEAKRLLSQRDLEIMNVACRMPQQLPSEKQCIVIVASYNRLRAEGMPLALPSGLLPG